jgi:DNA-binding MarR family transcriptional regulator
MTDSEKPELAVLAVRLYAESHPRPTQVTMTQAAEMLGLSRQTVSKLIKFGDLKLNGCGLIPIELVDRMRAHNDNRRVP